MKQKIKKLTPVIGILLFVYILYQIDLRKMLVILKSTNILLAVLATVVSLSIIFIMNLRWYTLIRSLGINFSYLESLKSLVKGITLGVVTPGKLGELYRTKYLMEKTDRSAGFTLSTVIVDRMLDAFTLLFLGSVCSLILINLFLIKIPLWLVFLFSAVVIVCMIVFLNERHMGKLLRPLANIFIPKRLKEKLKFEFKEFYKGVRKISLRTYIICFIFTLFVWLFNVISVYILAKALKIDIAFAFLALVFPVMILVNLIPISISGFGTIQASCILLLGLVGVSSESAVALSFLLILVTMWIYALPGAVLYLIKK
ncbi:flippase-like domain-containing protein [Candidatus Woesearchaeota archaeon]|nr:flippase-like domain-containing protein [Candidatus Woesearchaeota archaeon]